jgi:hypothetical protein
VVPAVEAAHEHVLKQEPGREGQRRPAEHREREAARPGRDPVREIGAQHVEGAVREVDHAQDAEHERQPGRDQEQHEPVLHGVQELHGEGGEVHAL